MKLARRTLAALGVMPMACSAPAPARTRAADHSAPAEDQTSAEVGGVEKHPGVLGEPTSADPATTPFTESPTTSITSPPTSAHVVTIPSEPPTTIVVRPRPLPTTTLPERADEAESDAEWWASQRGYSGVWPALAECESHNRNVDSGNGYSGFFQFSDATWRSMGTGYARAVDAPYAVQLDAAQRLQARSGWGQWPGCSRQLGLS